MSTRSCEKCSNKLLCSLHKKITEFITQQYLRFGLAAMPDGDEWIEFVGKGKCVLIDDCGYDLPETGIKEML